MTNPIGARGEVEDEDLGDDDTLVGDEHTAIDDVSEVDASVPPEADDSEALIAIHSGQALTLKEASEILAGHKAKVVVTVGEVGAGKTTLLSTMYEEIVRGAVQGLKFDHSLSLYGFEDRSFDAGYRSGNSQPLTQRTSRGTDQLCLHIAVRDKDSVKHLLLADVSGEYTNTLIGQNDPGDFDAFLRSASHVLVLIDGACVATPETMNWHIARTRKVVRALIELETLRPSVDITVVVTKSDLDGPESANFEVELQRLEQYLRTLWTDISVLRVAARPEGDGVSEIVASIVASELTGGTSAVGRRTHASRPVHFMNDREGSFYSIRTARRRRRTTQ